MSPRRGVAGHPSYGARRARSAVPWRSPAATARPRSRARHRRPSPTAATTQAAPDDPDEALVADGGRRARRADRVHGRRGGRPAQDRGRGRRRSRRCTAAHRAVLTDDDGRRRRTRRRHVAPRSRSGGGSRRRERAGPAPAGRVGGRPRRAVRWPGCWRACRPRSPSSWRRRRGPVTADDPGSTPCRPRWRPSTPPSTCTASSAPGRRSRPSPQLFADVVRRLRRAPGAPRPAAHGACTTPGRAGRGGAGVRAARRRCGTPGQVRAGGAGDRARLRDDVRLAGGERRRRTSGGGRSSALTDAAVRELTFRGSPEIFPGAGEYADR